LGRIAMTKHAQKVDKVVMAAGDYLYWVADWFHDDCEYLDWYYETFNAFLFYTDMFGVEVF
jgi:hypothetical protein